jgi:hypothetical protein
MDGRTEVRVVGGDGFASEEESARVGIIGEGARIAERVEPVAGIRESGVGGIRKGEVVDRESGGAAAGDGFGE